MFSNPFSSIGAIAAPVIGGLIGSGAASGASNAADEARRRALAEYLNIQIPTLTEQELQVLLPQYIGDYQTQLESALTLGPSAMEGISTDPRLQNAQMAALQQLSEIGQTGMTPAEAAALRQARRGAAGEAEAKSQQILQEMQRRGVAGSGMELAARLSAAQAGAERQSAESDRLMQMALERALQALSGGASLAGQMRGQEFGEKSDVARAKDIINQFNIQNQQALQARNVASTNQAALRNLQEQQRIAEAKTAAQNMQQQYNKELIQQQFQNRMARAAGLSGQYADAAKANEAQAGRTAQMWANIGGGVGQMLGGLSKPTNQVATQTQPTAKPINTANIFNPFASQDYTLSANNYDPFKQA